MEDALSNVSSYMLPVKNDVRAIKKKQIDVGYVLSTSGSWSRIVIPVAWQSGDTVS